MILEIFSAVIIFSIGIVMGVWIANNVFETKLMQCLVEYEHDRMMEDLKDYWDIDKE